MGVLFWRKWWLSLCFKSSLYLKYFAHQAVSNKHRCTLCQWSTITGPVIIGVKGVPECSERQQGKKIQDNHAQQEGPNERRRWRKKTILVYNPLKIYQQHTIYSREYAHAFLAIRFVVVLWWRIEDLCATITRTFNSLWPSDAIWQGGIYLGQH